MSSPMNKDWLERFLKGMHCRMSDTHQPNLGISIEIMIGGGGKRETGGEAEGHLPGFIQR
jgi:hypothetical protein